MYDILIGTLIRAHSFPGIFLDTVGSRNDPEPCGSCCVRAVLQTGLGPSCSCSIQPVRSDQPGGRRIAATWLGSCTASHTRSLRSALDFLVRDHGRFLLHFALRFVTEEELSRWEQGEPLRSSFCAGAAGINFAAVGKLSNSSWKASVSGHSSDTAGLNDGSPQTVAFGSEVEHSAGAFLDFSRRLCGIIRVVLRLEGMVHCVLLW